MKLKTSIWNKSTYKYFYIGNINKLIFITTEEYNSSKFTPVLSINQLSILPKY
jgi:hypothetical protein